MNFYLTQVISSHGVFNTYFFLPETSGPKCANCVGRGRHDNAWHTLFEYLAFQLDQEDVMTTLQETGEQPLTQDSLVVIMLRSADG